MGSEEVDWTADWAAIYMNSNGTIGYCNEPHHLMVCTQQCHYDKTK